MRFSNMLKWIEKVEDLLNVSVPNSKFFKRKSPCKSAFQNKLFADVSDPAGYSVTSGSCSYICPVVLYRTTEKRSLRNAGNGKGGNE